MYSKLNAAALATRSGVAVLITSAHAPRALERSLAGEDLGTLVVPARKSQQRRQIATWAASHGALIA